MSSFISAQQGEQGWSYKLIISPELAKEPLGGLDYYQILDLLTCMSSEDSILDLPTGEELQGFLHDHPEAFTGASAEWTSTAYNFGDEESGYFPKVAVFLSTMDEETSQSDSRYEFLPPQCSSPELYFRVVKRTRASIPVENLSRNSLTSLEKNSNSSSTGTTPQSPPTTAQKSTLSSLWSSLEKMTSSSHLANMINGTLGTGITAGEMSAAEDFLGTAALFAIPGVGEALGLGEGAMALLGIGREAQVTVQGARVATEVADSALLAERGAAGVRTASEIEAKAASQAAKEAAESAKEAAGGSKAPELSSPQTPHAKMSTPEPPSTDSPTSAHTSSPASSSADSTDGLGKGEPELQPETKPLTWREREDLRCQQKYGMSYKEWKQQLSKRLFERGKMLGQAGQRAITDDEALAAEFPDYYMTREQLVLEQNLYLGESENFTLKGVTHLTDRDTLSPYDAPTPEELGYEYNPRAKAYPSISSNHLVDEPKVPQSSWWWPFSSSSSSSSSVSRTASMRK